VIARLDGDAYVITALPFEIEDGYVRFPRRPHEAD